MVRFETSLSGRIASFTTKSICNEFETVMSFFGDLSKISGGVLSTMNEKVLSTSFSTISRAYIRKSC